MTLHGRPGTYNRGCHCDECREANRLRGIEMRRNLKARADAGDPKVPHGTVGGYKNWGCHCGPCTEANSKQQRAQYAARVARKKKRA